MKLLKITACTAILAILCLAQVACSRSRTIVVSLTNTSAQPLSAIVVDYPEATFGKNTLKPGETYQYRIKATDSGPMKITFTNAAGQARIFSLTTVRKNDEGAIEVRLTQDAATPDARLKTFGN
ncbi:MAG TPA: hypothetical protein VNW97_11930 [Candidatus Saccharimonadales bacterium]|jgi:hypothetical protein|nr:hypothetical protein [Candidatus Saccharimonadales bacterium]